MHHKLMVIYLTLLGIRKQQITMMCFFCEHTKITNIEMIDSVKSQQTFRINGFFKIFFSDESTNW